MLDQFERGLRKGFRIIGDKPVVLVDNLGAQACGRRSDHWLEFPHGFRYRQTKTLADGTLEHGTRIALKRIHLRVLDQVRVSEQVDIWIRSRLLLDVFEDLYCFDIIRRFQGTYKAPLAR